MTWRNGVSNQAIRPLLPVNPTDNSCIFYIDNHVYGKTKGSKEMGIRGLQYHLRIVLIALEIPLTNRLPMIYFPLIHSALARVCQRTFSARPVQALALPGILGAGAV